MDDNKIAYCGLYCGACRSFITSANNTIDAYSDETKIPSELLYCEGCRSEKTSLFCRNCAMRKCCMQKNILSCAECDEFPCSVLKAFENDIHLHHKGVIDSLKVLKSLGREKWLEMQKKKWSCEKCNEPLYWYVGSCPKCGNMVNKEFR